MQKYALEIKWGILFTVIALIWMVIEKSLGWHDEHIAKHATYTNFFAIIAIAVYIFALLEKRKQLGGFMTWKEGFISGMIITAIVTVLAPVAQWITHTLITPNYFSNAIRYGVDSGQTTQAEAEAYFNLSSYLLQATIGALLMGAVTSAVVAFILRKQPK